MPSDDNEDDSLPATLSINAWTGAGPAGASSLNCDWKKWASTPPLTVVLPHLAAPEPFDEYDWLHDQVGWGLVVADDPSFSEPDRALGLDLPSPLRALVEHRSGIILRYSEAVHGEFLRRYFVDSAAQDLTLNSEAGTGRGRVPRYLLLWASPSRGGNPGYIPWRYQYVLNVARYVGRLHLTGLALENYVNAALSNWSDSPVRSAEPLVWAVDHADSDITHLMRAVLADPVASRLRSDPQIGSGKMHYLGPGAEAATTANFVSALRAHVPPAFILTSSHGATGPLDDPVQMLATMGLPVDQDGSLIQPDRLLSEWQPNGAIWYAHACCSAGSDGKTQYQGLLDGGPVMNVLQSVAALGATVAPLPTALLGANRPLRAFIGHVEPTFDWTLRNPKNSQPTVNALLDTLYKGLYRARPEPVGMAFKRSFDQVGQLFTQLEYQRGAIAATLDPKVRERLRKSLLRTHLTALDRQSCVILGDPVVALPAM